MVLIYGYSPASFDRIVLDFVEKFIALHNNLDDNVDDEICDLLLWKRMKRLRAN